MAVVAQITGAVAVSVGIGMIFLPAGIIMAGLFSLLFGIAVERGVAERK